MHRKSSRKLETNSIPKIPLDPVFFDVNISSKWASKRPCLFLCWGFSG